MPLHNSSFGTFIVAGPCVWKEESSISFIYPRGEVLLCMDPSLVIKEQWEQLGGVQCLAQEHFNMQLWGERGLNRVPCGHGTTAQLLPH